MNSSYLISIMVPVYNVERYLRKCLDSIINQTYQNIEIILVDDGSKDNSGQICDEYSSKDSRIRVIHKENQGVALARMTGFDDSKGKYIAFVDGDDYIATEYIKKLLEPVIEYDVDLVCCRHYNQCGDKFLPSNYFDINSYLHQLNAFRRKYVCYDYGTSSKFVADIIVDKTQ